MSIKRLLTYNKNSNLFPFIFFTFIVLFINACSQGNSTVNVAQQEGKGINLPTALVALPPGGTLTAYIRIDNSDRQQMTINGDTATVSLIGITEGSHVFTLEFEYTYIDPVTSMPHPPIILASASQTMVVGPGSNILDFPASSYNIDGYDDDGDGVSNLDEINSGTNPYSSIYVSAISGDTGEDGSTASFVVALTTQPASDVTFTLSSSNPGEGTVQPTTITITPANWSDMQTVTVTGVNDDIVDGDTDYTIIIDAVTSNDPNFNGFDPADVKVTNIDNDNAGVSVGAISGNTTEGGVSATFTVVLDSQPTADVTIGLSTSDETEGMIDTTSLVFGTADWNIPQPVTVTGVNDDIADGNQLYTIQLAPTVSVDPLYQNLDPADVSVTNIDNDSPGFDVSPVSGNTTEAGGSASFTVVLTSVPTADVTMSVSSTDTSEGEVNVSSLTFTPTNWNQPQTVIINGINDDIDDGNQLYSITLGVASSTDGNFNGSDPNDVAVTNIDDDTAGFVISNISGNTTEAGGTATFTVALSSEPTASVNIGVSSSDLSEGTVGPAILTFTSSNWNIAQTVVVTGVDDGIFDGNQSYSVVLAAATSDDANYSGRDPADRTLINIETNLPPTATGVTISAGNGGGGGAFVGDTLTGNYTYHDVNNDLEGTSTFRWLRNGSAISNATSQTYVVSVNDIGQTITFEVTPVARTGLTNGSAALSPGLQIQNRLPVITEGADVSVTMDQNGTPTSFGLTLNATDADGDSLTWSISAPASYGTATTTAGPGLSNAIGYVPQANYHGADAFTVQVSDGHGGTDSIVVNVRILLPINQVTGNSAIMPDATLAGCINQLAADNGWVHTYEVTNLSCRGVAGTHISSLQGIEAFSAVTQLDFSNNSISDITPLSVSPFSALTRLYLNNNAIASITPLSTATMPVLNYLYLSNNSITDITPLSQASFSYLTWLDLGNNTIDDISPLTTVNFPALTYLFLNSNAITNITPLSSVNFPGLVHLNLESNAIRDISPLASANFQAMNDLNLGGNAITDIAPLATANFSGLINLYLNNNMINNITPLSTVNFPALAYLNLNANSLTDITPFSTANFPALTSLELGTNLITIVSPLAGLTSLQYLNLTANKIANQNIGHVDQLSALANATTINLNANRNQSCVELASLQNALNASVVNPTTATPNDNCTDSHSFDICVSCHDGIVASGKSTIHINTTNDCGACHAQYPSLWIPVPASVVDHTQVIGTCSSCHDGVIATGKGSNHIVTTLECDVCHTTSQWLASVIDHTGFIGNCISCHDGISARGKGPNHINSTNVCDACHAIYPAAWVPVAPAAVDHAEVIGTCSSCHNGVIATGKSANHIVTTLECDTCHMTTNWLNTAPVP